jgi:2,4-dienoyl-CoA reductase-like NADH-dependent reductase (Old Yellow Enzyme family)
LSGAVPSAFSPLRLGDLLLRNRIVRAACFEGMCPGGRPSEALVEHHRAVAAGGVAMTTVAYCAVSADGRAYGHEMWMREEIVPELRRLTAAVHREGAATSLQLGHCGFFASPRVIGQRPLGASRKLCLYRLSFPRVMTAADLERVTEDFVRAAIQAREAGFDAVEIHAGHGYLLSQFLSPWTNRRRDAFGGPLANRLRFPVEVVRRVRSALGGGVPVLVKMNVTDGMAGGLELEDAVEVARALAAAGATALVPSCGFTARTPFLMLRGRVPVREFVQNQKDPLVRLGLRLFGRLVVRTYPFQEAFLFEEARRIARAVPVPVALLGGVSSLDHVEAALAAGLAFVQVGRATIRDPDLINRWRRGEARASDCDHCNRCVAAMDQGGVRCVTRTDGPL